MNERQSPPPRSGAANCLAAKRGFEPFVSSVVVIGFAVVVIVVVMVAAVVVESPVELAKGLAFQLVDDVLDFTGTSSFLGKGSLSDIRHVKETLKNIIVGRAARCSRMVERAEELAITLAAAKFEPKKEAAPESLPIGPNRGAKVCAMTMTLFMNLLHRLGRLDHGLTEF
ncbi:solanesyl diphosphate synthase 3, chloroplastic/mitochondrial isoform X2 [Tanacetum coccineum]